MYNAEIECRLLVLWQLHECSIRLGGIDSSNSHQKARVVGTHRLNFVVRQRRQVLGTDKRVTATVQTHLAVHLRTEICFLFFRIVYLFMPRS